MGLFGSDFGDLTIFYCFVLLVLAKFVTYSYLFSIPGKYVAGHHIYKYFTYLLCSFQFVRICWFFFVMQFICFCWSGWCCEIYLVYLLCLLLGLFLLILFILRLLWFRFFLSLLLLKLESKCVQPWNSSLITLAQTILGVFS